MSSFRYHSFRKFLCITLIGSLHLQGILFYLVCTILIVDSSAILSTIEAQEYVVLGSIADHDSSENHLPGSPADTSQPISEEERTESEKSDTTKTITMSNQSDDAMTRRYAAYNTFANTIPYCTVFTPPPEVA